MNVNERKKEKGNEHSSHAGKSNFLRLYTHINRVLRCVPLSKRRRGNLSRLQGDCYLLSREGNFPYTRADINKKIHELIKLRRYVAFEMHEKVQRGNRISPKLLPLARRFGADCMISYPFLLFSRSHSIRGNT